MPTHPLDYDSFDEVAVMRLVKGLHVGGHVRPEDAAEAVRRLACDGYSDGQIAYRLGYSRRGIVRIRQRRNIPPALTPMQNRYDRIHDAPNRPKSKG